MSAPSKIEAHLQIDDDTALAPRWLNLTPWLLLDDESLISITRGKDDEGSEVTAGTCQFTLDNSDGDFTPGRSASQFYPNITTDKGVRIRFPDETHNMIDGDSADGEGGGVGYWGAFFASCTVGNSTTRAWEGTHSILITHNGTSGPLASMVYPGDFVMGKTYTASVYVWVPTGQPAVTLNSFDWVGGVTSTLTNQWQRLTVTFTLPTSHSRTDGVNFCIGWSAGTTGQQVWFDGFQVNEGSTAAAYNSSAYDPHERFTGTVGSWTTEWPGGSNFCVTRVQASDVIARLQTTVFDSIGVEQLKVPGPSTSGSYLPFVIYPLDDDSTSVLAHDASGTGQTAATIKTNGGGGGDANNSAFAFGAEGPAPGLHGCASFYSTGSGTDHTYLETQWNADPLGELGWAYDHTLFIAFKATDTQAGTLIRLKGDTGAYLELAFDGTGKVTGKFVSSAGTTVATKTSASTYNDGNWHTACLCAEFSSSFITLYVDGNDQGSASWSTFNFAPAHNHVYIGGAPNGQGVRATLGCAAVLYSNGGTPTSTPNGYFANAVRNGHLNDASTTRFSRYLDYARVPSAKRSWTTAYEQNVDNIDLYGLSAWDAIQKLGITEGGNIFALRDGRARFNTRYYRANRTPEVTIDQQGVGKDVKFVVDNQRKVNRVVATSPSAGSYIAEDTDDIAARGTYTRELELATTSWAALKSRADWELSEYGGDPETRVTNLRADITSATDSQTTGIRAVEIDTWIQVTGLHSTTAPATSISLVCEGYTEVIGWNQWGITFNTSPALAVTLLVLDDATLGTTDSTNRIGY